MKKVNLIEANGFNDLGLKKLLVHESPYFKILNFNFRAGQQVPIHSHDIEGQLSILILEGEGEFLAKDGTLPAKTGDVLVCDIAVPHGAPITATAKGQVLAIDDYFFNGKTVFLDHGNGLLSMYCHLDRIDVKQGDAIRQGQRLGLAGMTGRASGPHLHWSVVLNGTMVDPELFLKRKPSQRRVD